MILIFQHERITNKANPRMKTTKQGEESRKMGLDNRGWRNGSWEHSGKALPNKQRMRAFIDRVGVDGYMQK